VTLCIAQSRDRLCCSQCGCDDVWVRGHQERTFRTIPIDRKPVFVSLDVARVWCPVCDAVRQVKIGFADPKKRYTRSFERYALELSRHMTIKDVAKHLQVGWETIKDIQTNDRQRRFGKPKLHKLKQIAIDEIAVGKGQRYLTVVLNLLSGAVVFVGDGKGVEALEPLWKRLRRARAKIEAVATDMSPAYTPCCARQPAQGRACVRNARRKHRLKHGGDRVREPDAKDIACPERPEQLLALDEALDRLATTNSQAAELVKLRYFAGFSNAEAASILGISPRKTNQVWAYARARLREELGDEVR
jgi:hypothetical protein